jgi:hypothetical protein
MLRITAVSVVLAATWGLFAAPGPADQPARALVAGLGNSNPTVREASAAALKGRADAAPWLRRAARAADKDTARRAAALLAPLEEARQRAAAGAIDACVRDGRIDLLTEWHQYWKPTAEEDLWAVGPRAAKAGLDLYAKTCSKESWEKLETRLDLWAQLKTATHDGPYPERFAPLKSGWLIRTDRLDGEAHGAVMVRFASVAGPVRQIWAENSRCLILGPVETGTIGCSFVACDGGVSTRNGGVRTLWSVVVCRGDLIGSCVLDSVLLVDGDVDLTRGDKLSVQNSLIRATGAVRLPRGVAAPAGCAIEAGAKDATAPYRFFELSEVGGVGGRRRRGGGRDRGDGGHPVRHVRAGRRGRHPGRRRRARRGRRGVPQAGPPGGGAPGRLPAHRRPRRQDARRARLLPDAQVVAGAARRLARPPVGLRAERRAPDDATGPGITPLPRPARGSARRSAQSPGGARRRAGRRRAP